MRHLVKSISIALRALASVSPRLAGRAAFFLFCRPMGRGAVREHERDLHERAERSVLEVDGNQVVVHRWGRGERPVLMVHGWGGRASRFADTARALLDRGIPVIAFDAPGHGESSGSITHILHFEEIIERLYKDVGAFGGIVAHSFGSLGVFKALRSGVETDRVVSVNGVCDFFHLLDVFAERLGLGAEVERDLRERSERLLASGDDIWDRFSVSHDPDLIRAPILVVQDEDDDVVDPEQARRIVAAFAPRARLVTTEKLGHRRVLHSDRVTSAVVGFLADERGR
ncbi:alpha/beta hydrolase [Glycomyces xiaoerkulensis]|uniref:alpha/beta hydrolase n=1 Tax=Glycomyces xiaoerkulensis TaxID=2038139 RepID=UPI000C25A063|nr:alpha/beta fold hydrolase [Glycomyces xiaoerkulensis]